MHITLVFPVSKIQQGLIYSPLSNNCDVKSGFWKAHGDADNQPILADFHLHSSWQLSWLISLSGTGFSWEITQEHGSNELDVEFLSMNTDMWSTASWITSAREPEYPQLFWLDKKKIRWNAQISPTAHLYGFEQRQNVITLHQDQKIKSTWLSRLTYSHGQ